MSIINQLSFMKDHGATNSDLRDFLEYSINAQIDSRIINILRTRISNDRWPLINELKDYIMNLPTLYSEIGNYIALDEDEKQRFLLEYWKEVNRTIEIAGKKGAAVYISLKLCHHPQVVFHIIQILTKYGYFHDNVLILTEAYQELIRQYDNVERFINYLNGKHQYPGIELAYEFLSQFRLFIENQRL